MTRKIWTPLGAIILIWGAVWYRGRDVLMSDAEIAAAIPPELRYRPPTVEERRSHEALSALQRDIVSDSRLDSAWVVGSFDSLRKDYRPLVRHSGWVRAPLRRAIAAGPPAIAIDYGERTLRTPYYDIYRVLALRCDIKLAQGPRTGLAEDAMDLARFLRVASRLRTEGYEYDNHFPNYLALQTLHRVLDAEALSRDEMRGLLKALPTDEELVRAQQDRVRFDLETGVVHNLRPTRVYRLLNPTLQGSSDYRAFIVGRLDVPATLRRETDAAKGLMAFIASGRTDARRQAAAAERNGVMSNLPWAKPGEPDSTRRLRELGFRMRMLFHPNPRGTLVALENGFGPGDQHRRTERGWFALLRARLQLSLGVTGPLPNDPWTNRPVRYDSRRKLVWCVGVDKRDDGGTMSRTLIGQPDLVQTAVGSLPAPSPHGRRGNGNPP
ncbi:MAG: hypothetical protein ACO1SV_04200 [Fimbriimonas sp.]